MTTNTWTLLRTSFLKRQQHYLERKTYLFISYFLFESLVMWQPGFDTVSSERLFEKEGLICLTRHAKEATFSVLNITWAVNSALPSWLGSKVSIPRAVGQSGFPVLLNKCSQSAPGRSEVLQEALPKKPGLPRVVPEGLQRSKKHL